MGVGEGEVGVGPKALEGAAWAPSPCPLSFSPLRTNPDMAYPAPAISAQHSCTVPHTVHATHTHICDIS